MRLNLCKAALLLNENDQKSIVNTEVMKVNDNSRVGTGGKLCGRKALF